MSRLSESEVSHHWGELFRMWAGLVSRLAREESESPGTPVFSRWGVFSTFFLIMGIRFLVG